MAEEPREEQTPREMILERFLADPVMNPELTPRPKVIPELNPAQYLHYDSYPGTIDVLVLDNVLFHFFPIEKETNVPRLDQELVVLNGQIYANADTGLMSWTFGAQVLPLILTNGGFGPDFCLIVEHPEFPSMTLIRNNRVVYPEFDQKVLLTHMSVSKCFLWTDGSVELKWKKQEKANLRILIPPNANRIGTLRFLNDTYIGIPESKGGLRPDTMGKDDE